MCDILGCCGERQGRSYEWLTDDDNTENRRAVEALRKKTYSRDIELPERTPAAQKRYDTYLELDCTSTKGGTGGGSVYKYGDGHSSKGDSKQEERATRPEPFAQGGSRLGGESPSVQANDDYDAKAKAREAAETRSLGAPAGFSAAASNKLRQAAKR
jgi:hypothetical protein